MKEKKIRLTGLHARGRKRPHVWLSGPDEFKHSMYWPWQKTKAQAKFRGEDYSLTFDEYYELWKDDWHNKGRKADNICMTRRDPAGGWHKDNVELVTRQEHLIRQGFYKQHQSGRVPRGKGKKK